MNSPLDRARAHHAAMLRIPDPLPPAEPDIVAAIERIDCFLRRPALPRAMIQKAWVARSSLRGILKLL